jgi:signal transduction histidine kinase/ligand-binding sensor domain-containing protein
MVVAPLRPAPRILSIYIRLASASLTGLNHSLSFSRVYVDRCRRLSVAAQGNPLRSVPATEPLPLAYYAPMRLGLSQLMCALLIHCAYSAPLQADNDPALMLDRGQPSLRSIPDREGLLSGIRAMGFDTTGYMWVGTTEGPLRYNGRTWVRMPIPVPGLQIVTAIRGTRDGAVWFGFKGGIARLKQSQWTVWTDDTLLAPTRGERFREVFAFAETGINSDPILWVGTRKGVLKFHRGVWSETVDANGTPLRLAVSIAAAEDEHGLVLWVAAYEGVFRLKDGRWSAMPIPPTSLPSGHVHSILVRSDGRAAWAANSGGVAQYKDGRWQTLLRHDGISAIARTNPDTGEPDLWVTARDGVLHLQAGLWRRFTWPYVPPATELEVNAAGSVWIASETGLSYLAPGPWTSFPNVPMIDQPAASVTGMFMEAEADRVAYWFRVGRTHVLRASGTRVRRFEFVRPLVLAQTHRGTRRSTVWVGGEQGLARISAGRIEQVKDVSGFVLGIAEAPGDAQSEGLWVSSFVNATRESHLDRLDHGVWRHVSCGRARGSYRHLLVTGDGCLWAAPFRGGLTRICGERLTQFNDVPGFPSSATVNALAVAYMANGQSRVWAATDEVGAIAIDPQTDRWATLSTLSSPHLPGSIVTQVQVDLQGRIYFSTNKGVARLTPSDDPSTVVSGRVDVFTADDGLPSLTGIPGASITDRQGRIWSLTSGGLAILDATLAPEPQAVAPSPLLIERVLINQEPSQVSDLATLSYQRNNLRFEWASINLTSEGRTRYRSQLVGFDDAPSEWSSETQRTYTNLPGGRYQLHVWAVDSRGRVATQQTDVFSVEQAPWRSLPALTLYGLALVAAGAVLQRRRTSRQLALEQLRTRIALDLHDDVGASLTLISLSAHNLTMHVADQHEPMQAIATITTTARTALEGMREIVWSIDPTHDRLSDLAARMRHMGSELCAAAGVSFSLDTGTVDLGIDPDQRRELLRIFKEGLNNSIRHGRPRAIRARLTRARGNLVLEIEDDGVGFDVQQISKGHGLRSVDRRTRHLGGQFRVRSSPDAGTALSATIPIKIARRGRLSQPQ